MLVLFATQRARVIDPVFLTSSVVGETLAVVADCSRHTLGTGTGSAVLHLPTRVLSALAAALTLAGALVLGLGQYRQRERRCQ